MLGFKRLIVIVLAVSSILFYANEGKQDVGISFVGDILLGRGVERVIRQRGLSYPYEKVHGIFQDDDITIGNLECPITDSHNPVFKRRDIIFKADPQNAKALRRAGFDALVLANNHSMDYKSEGLMQTVGILESVGIAPIGAGENHDEARKVVLKKIKGVVIGVLAYSQFPPEGFVYSKDRFDIARLDREKTCMEVKSAKEKCDFLIVSMHWGNEYDNYPSDMQKSLARKVIESGGDIVVGHHPHVLQSVEKYKGKYIFYSLGNFIFDRQIQRGTDECIILKMSISKDGMESIGVIPAIIENARPRPAKGRTGAEIFEKLQLYSKGLGAQEDIGNWQYDFEINKQ